MPETEPWEAQKPFSNAGDAAFVHAVLLATGILSPHIQQDEQAAVQMLHLAALAGSDAAHLALSDYYLAGRVAPQSCSEALRYGALAAAHAGQDSLHMIVLTAGTLCFLRHMRSSHAVPSHAHVGFCAFSSCSSQCCLPHVSLMSIQLRGISSESCTQNIWYTRPSFHCWQEMQLGGLEGPEQGHAVAGSSAAALLKHECWS